MIYLTTYQFISYFNNAIITHIYETIEKLQIKNKKQNNNSNIYP